MVDMQQIESSNIKAIGYDLDTETLQIEFLSGGIYQYWGVSQDTFNELKGAPSKGSYFAANIKGKYPYAKIERDVS